MVELHFDPDKYIVAMPPSSLSSHDEQEILITRKRDDDMDYFSLLRGLESEGLRAWRWQPNGQQCLEMSYINTNSFSRSQRLEQSSKRNGMEKRKQTRRKRLRSRKDVEI